MTELKPTAQVELTSWQLARLEQLVASKMAFICPIVWRGKNDA